MSFSGIIQDYLGAGKAADRPATLNVSTIVVGFYLATDTNAVSAFNATTTTWVDLFSGTGIWNAGTVDAIGGGLQDASNTLQAAESINAQTGTLYTIVAGDRGKLVTVSNTSPATVVVPQAGASFPNGFFFDVGDINSGQVTILPTTSKIDAAGSVVLANTQGIRVVSDGTDYHTIRGLGSGGGSSTIVAGAGLSGGTITTTGTVAFQTIAAGDVLANTATVAAVPTATAVSAVVDLLGSVQGDILYRNASAWVVLPPGTSGQVLETKGAAANPAWANELWNAGTVTTIGTGLTLSAGTLATTGGGGGGSVTQIDTGQGLSGGPITTAGTIVAKTQFSGWCFPLASVSAGAQAFAFRGNVVQPSQTVTVTNLAVALNSLINGGSYMAVVASLNGSNVVQAVNNSDTRVASGTAAESFSFTFSPAVVLSPGTNYAMMVGRIDSTGTFTLPLFTSATAVTFFPWAKEITSCAQIAATSVSVGNTISVPGTVVAQMAVSGFLGS